MKLFRRGPTGQGYGNIYTPHAGSMIIQVQREHGLANRQIVLTERQVKLLKSLATRKWLVVGAFMILFDPIFEGLAISLMAGEVASLLLSRMTVPVVYFLMRRREPRRATRQTAAPGGADAEATAALHPAE